MSLYSKVFVLWALNYEFDEKVKVQEEDDLEKVEDDEQNQQSRPDESPVIASPIHTQEMDHIFNQFNEETNTTTTTTTTKRPSLSSNELHIVQILHLNKKDHLISIDSWNK
ncbi:unnamed protein product [Mucor hiemalis]